jgi:hypothetical protein
MDKIKLYLYPNAKPHVHDVDYPEYYNTVPMSKKGIQDHFVLTGPEDADYFYMGQLANDRWNQFSPAQFQYFSGNENRHICDIEGEGGQIIPNWLHNSIVTTMGPLKRYSNIYKLFARPTFSKLFLHIINSEKQDFDTPDKISFGFKGFINCQTRLQLAQGLQFPSVLETELSVNNKWNGPAEPGSAIQKEYIDMMMRHLVSLCPRGSGIDSVRLIESCYYNRVPVLISDEDYYLVGEDSYDTDFCFRYINPSISPFELQDFLQSIYDEGIDELNNRASLARKYFDNVIVEYFKDPTLFFLKWLSNGK